jgi:hypothetical protein
LRLALRELGGKVAGLHSFPCDLFVSARNLDMISPASADSWGREVKMPG